MMNTDRFKCFFAVWWSSLALFEKKKKSEKHCFSSYGKNTQWLCLLIMLVLLSCFSGCCDHQESTEKKAGSEYDHSNKTDPFDPKKKKTVIAVSYINGKNDYFLILSNAIRKRAEKSGYVFIAQDARLDPERQIRQMEKFIEDRVSAIVLLPTDSAQVGSVVRKANLAGIPVFTADVAINDPLAKVVCHIATDNYSGGKLAAIQMLNALGNKGKIAIVDDPELESVQLRTKGFREVVAFARQEGAEADIVASMPGYGNYDRAKLTVREILSDNPDIDGIFAINAPTCLAVLDVLREKKLDKKIKIVSFDGAKETRALVDNGIIYADIVQLPEEIGQKTFECLNDYLQGKMIISQILFSTYAYTKNGEKK